MLAAEGAGDPHCDGIKEIASAEGHDCVWLAMIEAGDRLRAG